MTKARDLADRTSADLTAVTAGTGISVTNGTGPIPTVTNTVATGFDAKGDLIVGTGADTFSKLTAATTNDWILTSASSESTGLKWAAPAAAGGMTLLSTTTLSGASTTINYTLTGYVSLYLVIKATNCAGDYEIRVRPNAEASAIFTWAYTGFDGSSGNNAATGWFLNQSGASGFDANNTDNAGYMWIANPNESAYKVYSGMYEGYQSNAAQRRMLFSFGTWRSTSAITSLVFDTNGNGNWSGGTVLSYGVK
jgi:hypothetical protein